MSLTQFHVYGNLSRGGNFEWPFFLLFLAITGPWRHAYSYFTVCLKTLRQLGIEPGSIAWKATMLTFTPPTLVGGAIF